MGVVLCLKDSGPYSLVLSKLWRCCSFDDWGIAEVVLRIFYQ